MVFAYKRRRNTVFWMVLSLGLLTSPAAALDVTLDKWHVGVFSYLNAQIFPDHTHPGTESNGLSLGETSILTRGNLTSIFSLLSEHSLLPPYYRENQFKLERLCINVKPAHIVRRRCRSKSVFMSAMAKRLGVELTVADSALEGHELIEKQSFDLVLTDIRMPRHDGTKLLQWVRENPDIPKDLPIFAFTARADDDRAEDFSAMDFDYVLTKPLQFKDLVAALQPIKRRAV